MSKNMAVIPVLGTNII